MSSMGLMLRPTFINANAPMSNGVGRVIPQLARITLKVRMFKSMVYRGKWKTHFERGLSKSLVGVVFGGVGYWAF